MRGRITIGFTFILRTEDLSRRQRQALRAVVKTMQGGLNANLDRHSMNDLIDAFELVANTCARIRACDTSTKDGA